MRRGLDADLGAASIAEARVKRAEDRGASARGFEDSAAAFAQALGQHALLEDRQQLGNSSTGSLADDNRWLREENQTLLATVECLRGQVSRLQEDISQLRALRV